jgi:nitrile hydratase accessory protein
LNTLDFDRNVLCAAEATLPDRADAEPLFPLAWHARIFALIVAMVENEKISWAAFQSHLVAALREQQHPNIMSANEINLQYFDCWLAAAEQTMMAKGLIVPGDVSEQIERVRASVAEARQGQI